MNRRRERSRWYAYAASLALLLIVATCFVGSAAAVPVPSYSTLFGGSGDEIALGTAVDQEGNLYVMGGTASPDLPTTERAPQRSFGGQTDAFVAKLAPDGTTTAGAFQTSYGGGVDGFLAKVDPAGATLLYSTYLGGSAWDGALTLDSAGDVYLSGGSGSADFPLTPLLDQLGASIGGFDVFVTKLSLDTMPAH